MTVVVGGSLAPNGVSILKNSLPVTDVHRRRQVGHGFGMEGAFSCHASRRVMFCIRRNHEGHHRVISNHAPQVPHSRREE